jgi:hypothetical protein
MDKMEYCTANVPGAYRFSTASTVQFITIIRRQYSDQHSDRYSDQYLQIKIGRRICLQRWFLYHPVSSLWSLEFASSQVELLVEKPRLSQESGSESRVNLKWHKCVGPGSKRWWFVLMEYFSSARHACLVYSRSRVQLTKAGKELKV